MNVSRSAIAVNRSQVNVAGKRGGKQRNSFSTDVKRKLDRMMSIMEHDEIAEDDIGMDVSAVHINTAIFDPS